MDVEGYGVCVAFLKRGWGILPEVEPEKERWKQGKRKGGGITAFPNGKERE